MPLAYPPGWSGWPDERAKDVDLSDLAMPPVGQCRSCRYTTSLSDCDLCGPVK
jgi:hypothetical protein